VELAALGTLTVARLAAERRELLRVVTLKDRGHRGHDHLLHEAEPLLVIELLERDVR
jgi:hypothetical protein